MGLSCIASTSEVQRDSAPFDSAKRAPKRARAVPGAFPPRARLVFIPRILTQSARSL